MTERSIVPRPDAAGCAWLAVIALWWASSVIVPLLMVGH